MENLEPTLPKNREVAESERSDSRKACRIMLLGASPSLTDTVSFYPAATKLDGATPADRLKRTGGNSGNQVIAYGLLKAISFDAITWNHSIGPARANDECSVIVIAAANFLHSGFDFGGMASFIEATKLPCVMVGVGAQSKDYNPDIVLQPGTERLMNVVAERSFSIGVRGHFTAEVLAKRGIHNVQVTGCPSYYMGCTPQLQIRKPGLDMNSKLMVNASRDVVSHSFDRERMISAVCELVSIAIERHGDFGAQSEVPEISIADSTSPAEIDRNFQQILREFPSFKDVASQEELLRWFSDHVRVYWDVPTWYEDMKKYDFVFGTRFHGCMIALQAGTPALVICHDSRTAEMCEFLGLPSIHLKNLDRVDIDQLYALVEPNEIQRRYSQLYPEYKTFLEGNGLSTNL